MYPKVGLVEETEGGGKEGKKMNNNETHPSVKEQVTRNHAEYC
jgi:hypothetical protein